MSEETMICKGALVGLTLSLIAVGSAHADTLTRSTIETVSQATYEVVMPKPESDPLTYERPLPLDDIPYAIRNDRYYSVGTAFAIGPNRWVSAAHVLGLGKESQLKPLRLRDRHGRLYDIDQIQKYSMRRDFVVFTLRNPPTKATALVTNPRPIVNGKVYAVGNALGEGIVFRDGLYTSDTLEERDGAWKWLRFSAAASPGNSGGPLLDTKGRVIGIVLRKSENENLNYALPITEVLNAPQRAEIDFKPVYHINNMDMTHTDRLYKEFALPRSYTELDREMVQVLDRFAEQLRKDFFAQHRDSIFPNGANSLKLLNTTYKATMPALIARGDDGVWDAYPPPAPKVSDLGKNGYVTYGQVGQLLLLRLHRSDDVPLEALFRDSRKHMDELLRGLATYRYVGAQRIRITSLGRAKRDEVFTDRYQRHWIVRTWNLPHNDQVVVSLSLPVPNGLVAMMDTVPTAMTTHTLDDLKALTDFLYLSYFGTLPQWREFLNQNDLLPPVFETLAIDFEYDKHFRYASKRLAFAYSPEQMRITPNSEVELRLAYFRENDEIVWDVGRVMIAENKDSVGTFLTVNRELQPPNELGDSYRNNWESVIERRHPYNRSAFLENKRTMIGTVLTDKVKSTSPGGASLLYTMFFGTDGNVGQDAIERKLKAFEDSLIIKELKNQVGEHRSNE